MRSARFQSFVRRAAPAPAACRIYSRATSRAERKTKPSAEETKPNGRLTRSLRCVGRCVRVIQIKKMARSASISGLRWTRPNPRAELNRLFRSTGDGSFTLRLPIFCCAEDFKYARAAGSYPTGPSRLTDRAGCDDVEITKQFHI